MPSFEVLRSEEDKTLTEILRDFPQLWAIHPFWTAGISKDVKVSQDMGDLKLALAQQSANTRFVFWYFSLSGMSGGLMQGVNRGEGYTWAEAIWELIRQNERILYLFLVGAPGQNYATEDIVIFRNPTKEGLDVVVGSTVQFLGSKVMRGSAAKDFWHRNAL